VTFTQYLNEKFGALQLALKTPALPAQGATAEELKVMAAKDPGSFPVQMMLAQSLRKAGDAEGAIAALERAAALVPMATGSSSPNVLIAAIARERKDNARAIAALEALGKVDHIDIESARALASLVAPLGDAARTAAAYERVVGIDPMDADAEANLGRYALERRDAPTAIRAFKALLAIGPADRAAAHANLAEAYLIAGQRAEAKKQTLAALEIAPQFERAQELLLKLLDGGD
jgi:tetratricopeptide (TPR) repeat protein